MSILVPSDQWSVDSGQWTVISDQRESLNNPNCQANIPSGAKARDHFLAVFVARLKPRPFKTSNRSPTSNHSPTSNYSPLP
jgi:hypothetical protein